MPRRLPLAKRLELLRGHSKHMLAATEKHILREDYWGRLKPLPNGLLLLPPGVRGSSAYIVDPRTKAILSVLEKPEEIQAAVEVRLPRTAVKLPNGEVINLATRKRVNRLTGEDYGDKVSEETVQDWVASRFRPEGAREERFTRLTSVLTRRADIAVKFFKDLQFPSAWHPNEKVIAINPDFPETSDEEWKFIYDKAKLFHENAHVLYTRHFKDREAWGKKTKDPDLFMHISNILEDGRIERLLYLAFPGTKPYIRAYGAECGLEKYLKVHPLNDLKFRSRFGRYLTAEGKKLFGPHEAIISAAIASSSSKKVWELSAKLTDLLASAKMPKPQGGKCSPIKAIVMVQKGRTGNGEDGDDNENADLKPQGCFPGGDQKQDGDQNQEGDGESPGGDGDSDGEGDGGDPEGGDPVESEDGAPGREGGDDPDPLSGITAQKPDGIVEQIRSMAYGTAGAEVQRELAELSVEDSKRTNIRQDLMDGEDEAAKTLAEVLRKWRVEARKEKWKTVHSGGQFDPRRLIQVTTGDAVLRSRLAEGKFDFDSVLIGDDSASMGNVAEKEYAVLRILTSALRTAGLVTKPLLMNAGFMEAIPLDPPVLYGGTPTGPALQKAGAFLGESRAARRVVFLVTDGEPHDTDGTIKIAEEVRREGVSIIGVGMGSVHEATMEKMCDRWVYVEDSHKLMETLPDLLLQFAAEEVR